MELYALAKHRVRCPRVADTLLLVAERKTGNMIKAFKKHRSTECEESELNLADRNDEEGPSSARFDDNGDEFGVDRAKGAVPRRAGQADVVNALLAFPHLGVDMAELALPDKSHTCGGKE